MKKFFGIIFRDFANLLFRIFNLQNLKEVLVALGVVIVIGIVIFACAIISGYLFIGLNNLLFHLKLGDVSFGSDKFIDTCFVSSVLLIIAFVIIRWIVKAIKVIIKYFKKVNKEMKQSVNS